MTTDSQRTAPRITPTQTPNQLVEALANTSGTEQLLAQILTGAQTATHAEGGTLYLLNHHTEPPQLEVKFTYNEALHINVDPEQGGTHIAPIPLYLANGEPNYHHIATHAALQQHIISVEDVYQQQTFDFSGTKAFDATNNYRTVSVLATPLLNHHQEVIGVLQLINACDAHTGHIVPFAPALDPLVRALGNYAAIALNNLLLVEEHKQLLDAFIKVIATAIDAKSPHTSGHCQRVPLLTKLIAEAACADTEVFADFSLNQDEWYELHVAAWLHDCGKLATPDSILEKSTKLHTLYDRIDTVKTRFAVLREKCESDYWRAMAQTPEHAEQHQAIKEQRLAELEEALRFLVHTNTGGEFMPEEAQARVRELAQWQWPNAQGAMEALLNSDEVENLCIERGTITAAERHIINDHMRVTIDMLESLPFPRKLQRVPEYAGGHHEKMDGTGFPRGLTRDEMSIPARMMGIADIFEALTAKDRPYKAPMKISQALSILQRLRDINHIDPDIYALFLRHRVWETYAKEVLTPEQLDVNDYTPYL